MTTETAETELWRIAPFVDRAIGLATSAPRGKTLFPYFNWKNSGCCPLVELGCVLASAIWNGALLDPRKWQPWLFALQKSQTWHGQTWVPLTFEALDETSVPRLCQDRWFADPLTKFHMDAYRATRTTVGDPEAVEVLEKFFVAVNWRWPSVERFHEAACARWRLRLPALLHDFALGRTGTTSLSEQSWRRLIGMWTSPAPRQAFVPRKQLEESRVYRRKSFASHWKSFYPSARVFSDVWKLQRRGVIDRMATARSLCAAWLLDESKKKMTPCKRILMEWCAFRLRQNRSPKFRKGYAPSTVYYRLSAVLSGVLLHRASDPRFDLNCSAFETLSAEALSVQSNPYLHEELERSCRDLREYLAERELAIRGATNEIGVAKKTSKGADRTVSEPDEDAGPEDAASEFVIAESRTPRAVCADIVSEATYLRLLTYMARSQSAPDGVLIVAILGFRCGLRINEILGARVGDFVFRDNLIELQLDRSPQRWLKTFDSRRVLPLNVFLPPPELEFLRAHLRCRMQFLDVLQKNLLFLGPICSRAIPDGKLYETYIDDCLTDLGFKGLGFRNFRHSFGTLTLTNLLLPDDYRPNQVPEALAPSLSLSRRNELLDALVGRERLGQASLHAVSQAMGHTGIQMTLQAYQHLLNFSLGLYVQSRTDYRSEASTNDNESDPSLSVSQSVRPKEFGTALYRSPSRNQKYQRSSSAVWTFRRVIRSNGRLSRPQRANAESGRNATFSRAQAETVEALSSYKSKHLDWYVIFHLSSSEGPLAERVRKSFGAKKKAVVDWRSLSLRLAARLNGSRRNVGLTVPQGAEALWLLNSLWQKLPAELTAEERRLVGTFVYRFDKRNSYARFLNVDDAISFRKMLIRWGARYSDIWVDEARGLNRRSSSSRKSHNWNRVRPGYDGYGAISIEREKSKADSMGWSFDIARHRRSKRGSKPADKRHRHVVYAYKFFLAMVALRENIEPMDLRSANSKISR